MGTKTTSKTPEGVLREIVIEIENLDTNTLPETTAPTTSRSSCSSLHQELVEPDPELASISTTAEVNSTSSTAEHQQPSEQFVVIGRSAVINEKLQKRAESRQLVNYKPSPTLEQINQDLRDQIKREILASSQNYHPRAIGQIGQIGGRASGLVRFPTFFENEKNFHFTSFKEGEKSRLCFEAFRAVSIILFVVGVSCFVFAVIYWKVL